jgi:hypothetical protein
MAGLVVPAIHVLPRAQKTWMRGDISAFTRVFDALCPRMTVERLVRNAL